MKIILLKILGSLALALGVLGAFLPLLPSTCFILLSAWSFSKSSPRFHAWLIQQSPFAHSIQSWQQNRSIPKNVKVIATVSLLSSYAITAMFISNLIVLGVLAAGMSVLLIYLLTRTSNEAESKSARFQYKYELNQPIV